MFDSINKKTLIIAGSSVIGLIVVIIIISAVVNALSPTYISYEKFEEKLSSAAKSYYKANPELLPTGTGENIVYYSSLEEGGYIKPITSLLKDGESCTAQVIVVKYGENYTYIPYLNCPGEYETKELYKAVLENNKTVTEKEGLYRGNDSYYFRGENINNYVLIDDMLWRIIKINNDNSMSIVRTKAHDDYVEWDNRYNIDTETISGVNDFEVSRIKTILQNLVDDPELLSDTAKSKLTTRELCIGKRGLDDTDSSGSIECSVMSEDSYLIGLITASEFMAASLDENCTTTISRSCSNYNFLSSNSSSAWTITAIADDSKSALRYSSIGLRKIEASISSKLYPVIFISKRAFYKSGTGSSTDPYIIR